ncbi:PAS domain S-box protein [Methanoregula sp.]|uniref:hybrid sensor histidine kinase/response regulator n=1 Tax=Methanoregula sp. TaxID=2052170 RepID=UPI00236F05AB|nr:PAS domain S-box protein [Methanoregula sp.]MDD1686759.1 PAS domain S-box protein [Methanoregula sp.]
MIRALYVDDEPALLEIGKLFLERSHDITIDTDLSANDALDKARIGRYDAIISDYQMPEMDGISLLKHIRSDNRQKTPFILFTGKGREEVVIDALNNGADYYLQKGGDPKAQFAELRNMLIQAVQRRKIEDELKKSEERYRNVVEDQTEAICRFRPDGTHVFANAAYCALVGKKKEDVIGKKCIPNIPKEDLAVTKNYLQSLTPGNPKGCMTQRITMADGSIRWVRCNDRAIFDDKGKVIEYQSVARDITEQKKVEDALLDSQRIQQYIINFMPDAMYAIDAAGKVIVWNKAAEVMTGVCAGDMIGKSDHEYAVPFYGKRIPTLVDLILHPGTPQRSPYEHVQKTEGTTLISESHAAFPDGRTIDIWIKASPLYDHEGNISGALSVIHDVSAYKQLEVALLQANRKLNLMSAVTRHGILNKLTALNAYLDLIKTEAPTPSISQRIDRIESTAEAIRRQIESTRQYQDLGVKAPLWHKVSDCFGMAFTHSHGEIKKVRCINHLGGLDLYADPLLEQVFANLIENSLIHNPDLTEISCSYEKTGNGLMIIYKDNGIGIPETEKESVFLEGYGKNSGLGLFFVREILEITGISISETGKAGNGVRFELHVPEGRYAIRISGTTPRGATLTGAHL